MSVTEEAQPGRARDRRRPWRRDPGGIPVLHPVEEVVDGVNVHREGAGSPMLLLHGIGHRWQVWTPLLGTLAHDHELVAVDLPGFGKSAPLEGTLTLEGAVDGLESLMDDLGMPRAHLVGNSLGGWLALELARRGRALSVTGLAPAGLWTDQRRAQRRLGFFFAVWVGGARRGRRGVALLRFRAVRTVALFGLFGRPWKIPADIAIGDALNLAESAFEEVYDAGRDLAFRDGQSIDVPVTIVWCGLDPLFSSRNCSLRELPAHTTLVQLPRCGHVPTWDDPEAVCSIIEATVARATVART